MDEFFENKREWSKYKDLILGYYLHPYIPKVARLNRKVLVVDCCAGPGRFGDGSKGSPVIIAEEIRAWRHKGINISGLFLEEDSDHFSKLTDNLNPFGDAVESIQCSFGDHLSTIRNRAKSETVFLYVDPYSVKGFDFDPMKAVYDEIHRSGSSVEVLMNFNVAIFMRWAQNRIR